MIYICIEKKRNLFELEYTAYHVYQLKLDNKSLIVHEFHVYLIVMLLVKVGVYLNVHHIDRRLVQAKKIRLHLDNQILDEEIARA
jgi:hypothetical protein